MGRLRLRHHPDALDCPRMVGVGLQRYEQHLFCLRFGRGGSGGSESENQERSQIMKRIRQYVGILTALVVYYIIHEGAHLLYALANGVFKQINFMALGVQIDVFRDCMTDTQLGLFCLAGAVATFLTGWILVLLCRKICAMESKVLKAVFWYVTIALLVLDPLYLSVLCGFFGGGDMNGIRLLMPEVVARILFAIIGVIQIMVIWKYLLPKYKESFNS